MKILPVEKIREADAFTIESEPITSSAVKEALERPVLTQEQAKNWNPDLEKQIAK